MFERVKQRMQLIYLALTDPESLSQRRASFVEQLSEYRLAYGYYDRKIFAAGADWSAYLTQHKLYKHTKLVFNPVPQIVDFYVDNIWMNANDEERSKLITPVADAENDKMIDAVAQLDQWSQWAESQAKVKIYAATTGACLVEIIDDMVRQKVTQKAVWRGFVTELKLNDAGDVQSYTLEYDVEENGASYRYKKTVDKEKYSYFRDDKPYVSEERIAAAKQFGGKPPRAVEPHNFGFCPAAWFQHSSSGDGAFTDYAKVNHANSLASHLHDNIHKEIESGKIISVDDPKQIFPISGAKRNPDGTLEEADTRLERILLAAKNVGGVFDLSGMLKLAEAHPYLKDLLVSFGEDYPELEYRQIIKTNGQLSGIALERLLTPAQNRLDRISPRYDNQLVKLRQMQTAIAGHRTKNGWSNQTAAQKTFAPFNLDSYTKGDLDFNLKRSVLIELNEDEREDLMKKKADRAVVLMPLIGVKRALGVVDNYDEKEINEIIAERAALPTNPQKTGETIIGR